MVRKILNLELSMYMGSGKVPSLSDKSSELLPSCMSSTLLVEDDTMVNTYALVACQGKPMRNVHQKYIPQVTRLVCFNCL